MVHHRAIAFDLNGSESESLNFPFSNKMHFYEEISLEVHGQIPHISFHAL